MGDTDLETMGNVTIAEYDYDDEAFDNVSTARSSLAQLSTVSPSVSVRLLYLLNIRETVPSFNTSFLGSVHDNNDSLIYLLLL